MVVWPHRTEKHCWLQAKHFRSMFSIGTNYKIIKKTDYYENAKLFINIHVSKMLSPGDQHFVSTIECIITNLSYKDGRQYF